jgi:hypothetical protein
MYTVRNQLLWRWRSQLETKKEEETIRFRKRPHEELSGNQWQNGLIMFIVNYYEVIQISECDGNFKK